MENKVNEYYELIEDEDLQSNESYDGMILRCPKCGALFDEKACGNRTIFPWWGYHPTDGNCNVLTAKMERTVRIMADNCDCGVPLERITKVADLTKAIEQIKLIEETN